MTQTHLTDTTFQSFALPEPIQRAIVEAGFANCTPIQARAMPIVLAGGNVIGQAKTGTGKTAAFLVAIFNRLLTRQPGPHHKDGQPRALILAPTRELAVQIHKDAEQLGKYTGLRLAVVFGGADYDKQRQQLEDGVDVLVATPGRIIDYFKQHIFSLKSVEAMVLDEADRMFDLGFIKDVRYLLNRLPAPETRLNLLFSATLSYRVIELAYEHMDNPQVVKVEMEDVTAKDIEQSVYYVGNEEKVPLMLGLFKKLQPERAIIFVNTKIEAERLCSYLQANEIRASVLSGDVPQKRRQALVLEFARGDFPVLVATDVAARGLHIPDVSHVFNYDLPQDAEDYVHRIGRTGRIGAKGVAISFACEKFSFSLPEIEQFLGKKITLERVTTDLLVAPIIPKRLPSTAPDRRPRPSQGGAGRPSSNRPRPRSGGR